MGIREMTCRRVVRRLGDEAWRGFCRGAEIGLTFDERFYVGKQGRIVRHPTEGLVPVAPW